MTIPPRYLDELRNRLALSDIIGKRVKVTRAGREYKACCPFHKEKTPSFTINDDKQFYHCFGCGAHGDVIGFVMQHDNLSFIDAVETLSALAGMQMPKLDPKAIEHAEKAKDLHALMEDATAYCEHILHNDKSEARVLEYLTGRGLTIETIRAFRIGYAPADRQALRKHLKQKGYDDAQMIEAGMVKKSAKGGEPYVFFRERVMFPVTDRRGRVVAFGGRILPDHLRPPDRGDYTPAKYMNSSETPVFDKGRMLYGEAAARQAARDGQSVIVTEGYMDVIACAQAGFKGAVAPMGTALTEDQILSLWSMIPDDEKVPVLCFDGDNAGRSAASRACERILPLLKPGQSVRFAFMPDGEDPDSLIRAGGKVAFQTVIDAALPLFDFIWASHMAGRRFDTPESRAGVTKALEKHIFEIADSNVQSHYRQLLRTRISEIFFPRKQNYGGRGAGGRGGRGKKPSMPSLKIRRPSGKNNLMPAKILMAAVINHPVIYPDIEEEFGRVEVTHEGLGRVKGALIEALDQDQGLDSAAVQAHLRDEGLEQEMSDILSESVYVHAVFASPKAEQALGEGETVSGKWIECLRGFQENVLKTEIKKGWKDAFERSNEDDEERLRTLVQLEAEDAQA